MTSVAVIQARTNSKRLPGKARLDVKGFPIAVLAAKRAANTGRDVIVATSTEVSDDALAATLVRHGLDCFRGSLEDPLKRFVDALRGYDDETIVFRLTADNVLPDGNLLDELERQFLSEKLEYLCCNNANSGLPYGISAELTRLKHLREAEQSSRSPYDREHVTPYIIRKFGQSFFTRYSDRGMGHYRCTVDCLDDYIALQDLFEETDDPVAIGFLDFLSRLSSSRFQPFAKSPVSNFILGAAQLGLSYGIANASGQPDEATSEQLIKTAILNGVQGIDTARAYGDSEKVVGTALDGGWEGRTRIATKLSPLDECAADASAAEVEASVEASVFRSLVALRTRKIDVLSLHRASHLRKWNGAAWQKAISLRNEGWIGELGVSVQDADELELALAAPDAAHIQLPLNLMDWRWEKLQSRILSARAERGVKIQVRSAFLQGLLNSRDTSHWHRANIREPRIIIDWLESMREEFGRSSIADLCIAFVTGLPWVDGVVVGLETMEQLRENISLFENPPLTPAQLKIIMRTRPVLDEESLDPSCWKAA